MKKRTTTHTAAIINAPGTVFPFGLTVHKCIATYGGSTVKGRFAYGKELTPEGEERRVYGTFDEKAFRLPIAVAGKVILATLEAAKAAGYQDPTASLNLGTKKGKLLLVTTIISRGKWKHSAKEWTLARLFEQAKQEAMEQRAFIAKYGNDTVRISTFVPISKKPESLVDLYPISKLRSGKGQTIELSEERTMTGRDGILFSGTLESLMKLDPAQLASRFDMVAVATAPDVAELMNSWETRNVRITADLEDVASAYVTSAVAKAGYIIGRTVAPEPATESAAEVAQTSKTGRRSWVEKPASSTRDLASV